MRKYSNIITEDPTIRGYLDTLVSPVVSSEEYSLAFLQLGVKLSECINKTINIKDEVIVASTTEDADWLTKGIFDNLLPLKKHLAVFWNKRTHPFENSNITIAPIVKTYIESDKKCDVLVICKSIIYTSCVVRTNLNFLIENANPEKIIIAAPVIFKSAEELLKSEFPLAVSSKFKFVYFAIDDQVNKGMVVPGVGGDVYTKMGFKNSEEKNKYIPNIVKERRQL
jgi:hypothetical protein